MSTPEKVLDIARGEIGYDRWTDPNPGTKYGRWYASYVGDSYYGTSGVPYCAMFVSWVFYNADQSAPGLPGAYCPWIVNAGRNAGMTVSKYDAAAGDIVLFDWGGDGVSDHVGIVEANNGSYLTTIEGNTSNGNDSNGGKVQRRTRSYSTVICVIRPDYQGDDEDMPLTQEDLDNIAFNVWNFVASDDSDRTNQYGRLAWALYNGQDTQRMAASIQSTVESLSGKANVNIPATVVGGTIHRLTLGGAHRWESEQSTIDELTANGWTDEGSVWDVPEERLVYQWTNGYDTVLSADDNEQTVLKNGGWACLGPRFKYQESGTPVTRLYNNTIHLFSTDANEIDALKGAGWKDEGIAFYI